MLRILSTHRFLSTGRIFAASLVFFCISAFTACLKPAFYRRMDKTAIPADLTDQRYVLLVQSFNEKPLSSPGNQTIVKLMQQYYPSRFEVIHPGTHVNNKYDDKTVYRYYLTWIGHFSTTKTIPQGTVVNSSSSYVLHFVDRQTGNITNLEEGVVTYSKAIKFFAQYASANR